ncbi:Metallo-hydrolase/oxidoreductase [Cryphonectria parasitica EP155]|uniref:Metallo-hydrolase/oxidoreductase n=1 Tax=Cryphonectria parasitica (strain ATCC 38755 / EP155) TaxID=660469 RepID=A0A9P4Y758_CRYP1|nr:Metallo-hydrolase/oxidoreductase [Cryphonectria parasitica EP155]KAF3767971.1 Metallo-hydrolase/oxidoreductase [Cryphonectria parasitica EP155]
MAKSAPKFEIEPSSATVDVRIIDTTSWIGGIPTKVFFTPVTKGYDTLECPAYSFLIEHPSGRKLLFDLGVRKDWENLCPVTVDMIKNLEAKITVQKDVREILEDNGISASSIEGIVWSHWHFDHTGDPSTFGPSTALIVGPGFKDAFVPGYPTNAESVVLESDYAGRELKEITFSPDKKVGRFESFDYFGDGSFYLLNSPGHAIGHLCALARVTSQPDSYILMGGDASHQAGEFRPSAYLPLPESISPHPLESHAVTTPCPGSLFEHLLPHGDTTKPFYSIAKGGVSVDAEEAERTIAKLQEADAQDKVLVVIAHDTGLLDVLDFFPKSANDFASKGWVKKGRWAFLKDFKDALL